mmetsp:Transcript_89074/g.141812  ORF Transcript_89074/g.141812 Transcript_89074/m.141812 type:complete len:128 (-) Transcript_89074:221-604(-)
MGGSVFLFVIARLARPDSTSVSESSSQGDFLNCSKDGHCNKVGAKGPSRDGSVAQRVNRRRGSSCDLLLSSENVGFRECFERPMKLASRCHLELVSPSARRALCRRVREEKAHTPPTRMDLATARRK